MDPKEYEKLRAKRATELRDDIPNGAGEIRVVSTPLPLVRAGQEYLRRQREQVNVGNTGRPQLQPD